MEATLDNSARVIFPWTFPWGHPGIEGLEEMVINVLLWVLLG